MFKVAVLFFVFTIGCSSALKNETFGKSVVLERIDSMNERPTWLKESEAFKIENGYVLSLGQTTISADNRIEAGYRIAENNGKGAISSAIEQRLDYIFQNAEEGTSMDSTQSRFIGAEASKITTNAMRVDRRYWEKILTTDENGQKKIQFKIFAIVKMPEGDFKQAILDSIRKQQGKSGISADFSKKVEQHWDQFVNNGDNLKSSTEKVTESK